MPRTKARSKTVKPKKSEMSKSDFIRLHEGKPAPEIVRLAAKAGIKMSDNLIYVVRSYDRTRSAKALAKGKDKAGAATPHEPEMDLPYEHFWNAIRPGRAEAVAKAEKASKSRATKAKSEATASSEGIQVTPEVTNVSASPSQGDPQDLEQQFVFLIMRLGVDRSRKLFEHTLNLLAQSIR